MKSVNLSQLKEREIDARLSAKVAKVVWQELVREAKILKRQIARVEGKVLVCLVLLVLVGGCATCKGIFQDVEWSAGKLAENIETEK